jgi:Ca2+-binding RTX toxin-like protein
MATTEELLDKINQRIENIQRRVGAIAGGQNGTEGKDRLFGSDGNDEINGLGDDDQIFGSFGDDALSGGGGRDLITGGFGNDFVQGGEGNDRLFGDFGDDLVFGDNGNDLVSGSAGGDVLSGGAGNDNLLGGTNGDINGPEEFFQDFLVGGSGSDTLNAFGGGKGNIERDTLLGGGAVDDGGGITDFSPDGARDTFVLGDANGPFYTAAGSQDNAFILDFEPGIDKLQLSSKVSYGQANGDNQSLFATLPDGSRDLIAIFPQGINFSNSDITFV